MIDSTLRSNEVAQGRIVPPPTIRSQRRIAAIRLLKMQVELSSSPVHIEIATDEVDLRRAA